MQANRLLTLDGLRAVAILAVILLHTGVWRVGGVGVDLFFVLSGFLITGILVDAKDAATEWRAYAWPFYMRRALRIFPVAFAALGLGFIVAPAFDLWPAVPIQEQFWFWTYLSNWYAGSRSYGTLHLEHFWSLAVEEQFYFVWPFIVWWCPRSTVKRICLACVVLVPLLRMLIAFSYIPASATLIAIAPRVLRFDGLAAGAWLAIAAREPGGLVRWRSAAWCALPVGVALVSLTGDIAGFVLIFAAALIFALTSDARHPYPRILTLPPLVWIGRVSYVVYVVQFPIGARLLGAGVAPLENLAVTIGVSLFVAWASWRWFEQPILAARTRWPMPTLVRPAPFVAQRPTMSEVGYVSSAETM